MKLYRYQHIPGKVACVKEKVSMTFASSSRLVNYTCNKLFYNHPLTQCYLLEFYRNFKLMLITPNMSETRTKATSTSHQTSTSPETQLAKIQASASTKTCQEDTDTMLTYTLKPIITMFLYSTVLCCTLSQMCLK